MAHNHLQEEHIARNKYRYVSTSQKNRAWSRYITSFTITIRKFIS